MAALSYMQRRKSGTYEFRRRLPEALAGKSVPPHMREAFAELVNPKTNQFKREVVRSLGTKDVREAKRLDHWEALKAGRLFDDATSALGRGPVQLQVILPADPKVIADEVFAELLAEDEMQRVLGDDRRRIQTPEFRAKNFPDLVPLPPSTQLGMSDDHFFVHGDYLAQLEKDYRAAYARRAPQIVFPETNIALKRRGIFLDKSSQEFQTIALAVLEAHVRACALLNARQRGDIIPTPQPVTVANHRPKLSEAFEAWKAGGVAAGARKPNANTIKEAIQAIRYFTELHGDLPLGDITRERARQFRDAVAKVPRSLSGKLKSLPLSKLMEEDLSKYEPRQATTVHKMLQILGAVISKAEREGFLDKVQGFVNPFGKGIQYAIAPREAARKHFDKTDLEIIFGSAVFARNARLQGGGGEAAFWFPLIGLYSGMRLDEIAQLRICDLRQDSESRRWFFDVDRSGGRSTKTSSSVRQVPVHRELERIGLMRYRQDLLDRHSDASASLWPDVRAKGARPRSASWSKWFGRYLRETCNITDSTKVFHSFRHTFKRMTRDAGIAEEVHDALTGHSSGNSVGRSYGRGFSLAPLADAMDSIKPPIDLGNVVWKVGGIEMTARHTVR